MTEEMYRLIEKINREDKITIIMISHDIRGAMEYASHILQIGQEVDPNNVVHTSPERLGPVANTFISR